MSIPPKYWFNPFLNLKSVKPCSGEDRSVILILPQRSIRKLLNQKNWQQLLNDQKYNINKIQNNQNTILLEKNNKNNLKNKILSI